MGRLFPVPYLISMISWKWKKFKQELMQIILDKLGLETAVRRAMSDTFFITPSDEKGIAHGNISLNL